jgi:hypothetical protein
LCRGGWDRKEGDMRVHYHRVTVGEIERGKDFGVGRALLSVLRIRFWRFSLALQKINTFVLFL